MSPDKATASVFHRFMKSGRTAPMLSTCVLHGDVEVDVVIKLNGAMDFGTRSAVFELVGSLMACKLGIDCPKPYLVWLSPEFINAVILFDPLRKDVLHKSIGWNFGSEMLKDASIWTSNTRLTSSMLPDALKIFSFDGLIQNVDRRDINPNMMTRGDRLCAIDHECAFTFLSSIFQSNKPWTLGTGDYMERHALRSALRGNTLDWTSVRAALTSLTEEFFTEVASYLPTEWNGTNDLTAIRKHVSVVLSHSGDFEFELQRRIA